jgi:hypothetical protein
MSPAMVTLTAGGGLLACCAFWYGLIRRSRIREITTRQLLFIILTAGLTCRLVYAVVTPTFYAPDEQPHFKYVQYLAEKQTLPVQTNPIASPTNDWEYYQPPLYYICLAPLYTFAEWMFRDTAVTVGVLRTVSILLWGMTIFFAIRILDILKVQDSFLRIVVIGMISLLPTYTFISAVINNDNLAIALGSAILYLSLQPATFRRSVLIGILLGMALLTKLTATVYVVMLVLIPAIGMLRKPVNRPALLHIALQVGLAAILWTPWGWRNLVVYGSITAEGVANILYPWKSIWQALCIPPLSMQKSFWAVSGRSNNINFIYPVPGVALLLVACAGWIIRLRRKLEPLSGTLAENSNVVIALSLTIAINALLVYRFGVLYGVGQGRFLFPSLIPISLLMGIGLRAYPRSNRQNSAVHMTGFLVTYAISFLSYSLAMFTQP